MVHVHFGINKPLKFSERLQIAFKILADNIFLVVQNLTCAYFYKIAWEIMITCTKSNGF